MSRALLVKREATSHDMRNPHEDKDCEDAYCQFCQGGIEVCANCGGSEASLTTDCPLEQLSYDMQQRIVSGVVDYQTMTWVELGPKAVYGDGE